MATLQAIYLSYLAHLFTVDSDLVNIKSILIIIQRSNGDVFLSSPLIEQLQDSFLDAKIDLLVNADTISIAKTLTKVNQIYEFSYKEKNKNRYKQERNIFKKIYRKYDLSINLTSSDRSVIYSLIASKKSISAIEKNKLKSWWKKILLKHYYFFDEDKHILINNLKSLDCLGIKPVKQVFPATFSQTSLDVVKNKLNDLKITKFVIFHPSAQYHYKVYNQDLREDLLSLLDSLNIPIVITGGGNDIDIKIKQSLPKLKNVYDFINETSIDEFIALSSISKAYIGMDTLNMHIAASQNKRIFAIFGPTNISMWSPWSNYLETAANKSNPIIEYNNITIFQAALPCVACGKEGCQNNGRISECLDNIDPKLIFKEIREWFLSYSL